MQSRSVLRNVVQPKPNFGQLPTSPASDPEADPSAAGEYYQESELETQYGILVDNAPVALSMFDDQMRYMVANRLWIEEFGLQHVQPIIGRSQYEVFPGLHAGWRQVYERALQGHVVRSEHDAISGQDGQPIVYRWEVRPWRRKQDASIGGLMVSCEKFTAGLGPVSGDKAMPAAPGAEAVQEPKDLAFQSLLPIVILNGEGIIVHANDAAVGIALSRGVREGASFYWDAFGDGWDHTALRERTLASIQKLTQEPGLQYQTLITSNGTQQRDESNASPALPAQWALSRTTAESGEARFVAVAMLGASLPLIEKPKPAVVQVAAPDPAVLAAAAADAALVKELQEKLNRARQEVTVMRDAEQAFARREGRQRAVLEALACGLLVLDERGMPIYHNENVAQLLGRGIQRGESAEQWLMQACPTDAHKQKVSGIWSQDIWSRQLTRVLSLVTSDGMLKELEFRPVNLNGGGVLVSIQDVTDQCRIEDLLQATEAKFRVLLQESPTGILLVDKGGAVFEVNPVAEDMIGRAKTDLRRMLIDEWLSPESAAARKEALRAMRDEGRRSAALDIQIHHSSGALRAAHLRIALVNDPDGQTHCTLHFLQPAAVPVPAAPAAPMMPPPGFANVADEVHEAFAPWPAEPEVSEPRITVRWLLQTDQSGRVATWSNDAKDVFGFESAEIVGSGLHTVFRPSDPTGFYGSLQDRAAIPEDAVTWSFYGKEGRRGSGRFFVKSAGEGGYAVDVFEEHVVPGEVVQNSSARSTPPARTHLLKPSHLWPVADLDREKLLLSETHHRIKNHLQIISSMLNLQLNSLIDEGARSALRSSQNRVRSIAALHQHLHQLVLGEGPGFEEFAKGLADRLRECYEVPAEQVAVHFQIAPGNLQQEWMMPLALILNETLSNAFEHAFPNGRRGWVAVRLSLDDGKGEFEVSDNGIGLPAGFDTATAPGLGLKILGVFVEQMRGELRLSGEPERGTKFNLRFPMADIDN
jgi:PAS domain S-box-containing protein